MYSCASRGRAVWRARWWSCRRWFDSRRNTARTCTSTRRTASARSARTGAASSTTSAPTSATSTCRWARSPRASAPPAATSPAQRCYIALFRILGPSWAARNLTSHFEPLEHLIAIAYCSLPLTLVQAILYSRLMYSYGLLTWFSICQCL